MSDYLNHLLTRTLEPARAVRPRRASVFEPSVSAAPSLVDPLAEDEARVSATSARLARPSAALSRARAANDPRASPSVNSSPTTAATPASDDLDARSSAAQTSAALPSAAIRSASARTPRAPHQSPEDFAQHETETLAREPRVSPASTNLSTAEDRSVARTASELAQQLQLAAHLKRINDERVIMRDALRAERHDAPAFAARGAFDARHTFAAPGTVVQPVIQAISSPATTSATAQAAPVIRITIGRVDVRAVMPTSPPPATARRPADVRRGPSLSLKDYLQQREGGKR